VYQNRTNGWGLFELFSSHPDILSVFDSKVEIKAGEKVHIRIKIPKKDSPGIGEACLFISD